MSTTEVVLVLAVLVLLGVTMVPDALDRLAMSRDTRRLQDLELVRAAIERYRVDHGDWPPAHESPEYGGWDVSHDGDFLPALVQGGYLPADAVDPVNDERYQYRYRIYEPGSFGCKGEGRYYVLGVREFETSDFQQGVLGGFECLQRDWGQELAWVTGDGASYR